ncbi:MFS transporter [Gulosibacter sp. 10]|uniref:MFS transporter n=1 Tax=Gulosibacter sp. 10 TaxID=1255570 RepID=UPI00097F6842|nr:MFS transporter [Gulosibacter sp. 10]SJM64442.1 metabolite transporter, MFS superfamily [Gulosibacter sp. 10]
MAHTTASAPQPRTLTPLEHFKTTMSSTLGTALEFYDFAIYGLAAATVFKTIFFADSTPAVAFIASLATFAVGYVARPLGGIILGAIGDRVGRKNVMVWTVVLMGLASTLIGALPTYQQVGLWAPVLLVTLRILQGLGAGAELASSSTLLVESTPAPRRGLIGSLVGIGTNGGTLLASLAWMLVSLLPEEQLLSWGWRVPFLASIIIAGVGLWMRRTVKESPAFEVVSEEARTRSILQTYGYLLKNSTGKMLACIGMRWAENGISTVFLVFFVGRIGEYAPDNPGLGSLAVVLSAIVGLGTVPLFGWISDRFGRRRTYLWLCVLQLVVAFPSIWMIMTGQTSWVVLAFVLGYSFGVMGMYAVQSAYMVELFGSRSRLAAVTASKELGALTSGGVAPVLSAMLIGLTGNEWIVGGYMVLLAIVSIVSTIALPETAGRDLVAEEDAVRA